MYLEADRIALGRTPSVRALLWDEIWRFERALRRWEYWRNCRTQHGFLQMLGKFRVRALGRRLGYTIPPNVFGPGLSLVHPGTIVASGDARIGANCRCHVCVNIGVAAGTDHAAPRIGDNCYIGPGAKIFGPIVLGDNIAIGANAVVNRSFPESNVTLAGVPARIVSGKGSEGLLHARESGGR